VGDVRGNASLADTTVGFFQAALAGVGGLAMTRRPATMGPSCPASLGRRTAAVGIVTLRVILVTVMFQAIAANTEHMACPTDCFCLGNMVDCSKKRLKRVPDDLPSWVQIL